LRLERGLVGNVVVEVVASDVNDDLTRAAVVRLLTLDARRLHRALFAILTSLTGSFIAGHITENRVNVGVDDHRAVSAFIRVVSTNVRTLRQELRLERVLVGNVVVEVVASDVDYSLAEAAVVRLLTLHAMYELGHLRSALLQIGANFLRIGGGVLH